jgi:trans-feruloyl-CoA hydratase/vanillin synthase
VPLIGRSILGESESWIRKGNDVKYETILVEKAEGIATITLNRPDKRNAMSPKLHEEMYHVLEALRYDNEARVIVITGAGKAFCAGMDLKELFVELDDKPLEYDRIHRIANDWRGRILRYYPKPTIAMINGFCFGGAFAMVEGCHLAFASEEAIFALSEVNFKLFPGGAVSKALANLLRPRDALFYGLTGRQFDGKKAAEIGLINIAFPAARLREETMAIARDMAAKDFWALRATIDGYRLALESSWEASMSYTDVKQIELQVRQAEGNWVQQGIGDFLKGKYKPGLESHDKKKK